MRQDERKHLAALMDSRGGKFTAPNHTAVQAENTSGGIGFRNGIKRLVERIGCQRRRERTAIIYKRLKAVDGPRSHEIVKCGIERGGSAIVVDAGRIFANRGGNERVAVGNSLTDKLRDTVEKYLSVPEGVVFRLIISFSHRALAIAIIVSLIYFGVYTGLKQPEHGASIGGDSWLFRGSAHHSEHFRQRVGGDGTLRQPHAYQ